VSETFTREKEQILTQFIIHHEVGDAEVGELAERLDTALARARDLHTGQKRRTGEDYIWHPLRTAMEVSRYGRIVDWAAIEAALLHDTLEDTALDFNDLAHQFPEAANLVLALTKIKDSRVHTYQKLFNYVLQDIRVLLVKVADRLDNLESLAIFKREKQVRIARETEEMYTNICRRLCMLDLAERLTEKIGPILTPAQVQAWDAASEQLQRDWARPLRDLRGRLAELFPGDLAARIELQWNRFRPDLPPTPENLLTLRVVTDSSEGAYRALGRVHMAFRALPGTFSDTISIPHKNGYRALQTRVAYKNRIISCYLASRAGDRFNRLGLLAMDLTSPEFNLEYMTDLREFLQNEDMDIQDFLRFHKPEAIQVTSPGGDVFSLEDGATALDFAFAVHEHLGLRSVGALVNGEEVPLGSSLRPGDRVEIRTADEPVADDRYLAWAHTRRALTRLRRHLRRVEAERATATGHQWVLDAAHAQGLSEGAMNVQVRDRALTSGVSVDELYRQVCLGGADISEILGIPREAVRRMPGSALFGRLTGREGNHRRRVRRYRFDDPHIRFCGGCMPVEGDEIEGVPEGGRLLVHRHGCPVPGTRSRVPLAWEKGGNLDLQSPGPVELEVALEDGFGVLHSVLAPFKDLAVDIRGLRLLQDNQLLHLQFQPSSHRTLNRLIRALRKLVVVTELQVFRGVGGQAEEE
jgi:(p)ppGpp synthase/HD superfamily hydrolase